MKNISKKYYLLAFILALLQSCGWQLRGSESLTYRAPEPSSAPNSAKEKAIDVNPIYAQDQRDFRQIFNRLLSSNEIKTSYDAKIVLAFEQEKISRRAQAYGSTGIPAQFLLTMSIDFTLTDKENRENTVERKVIARRDYDFDAELVGAKDREQQDLLNEMREELARKVLRITIQNQR